MIRLTEQQIQDKLNFIEKYKQAKNAADGSSFDPNANVSSKNIATLTGELYKDFNIQLNRAMLKNRISELYGEDMSNEFIRQLDTHEIYVNDETSLNPYCASVDLFPLLVDGMKGLGGESESPKHLKSFCGMFINACYAISSNLAGAIATTQWLLIMDHFARKDYGDDYLNTNKNDIKDCFENVVYSVNMPSAARSYQSIFLNISIYDEHYFKGIFEGFVFPDGDTPKWETLKELQKYFLEWFNKERTKNILTFPVVTAAHIVDKNGVPQDEEFTRMCAKELAEGNSFFMYQSNTADSLSSCCRLRNDITKTHTSATGATPSVSTGSVKVMTMNINRMIQLGLDIKEQTRKVIKYLNAYRTLVQDMIDSKMLPIFDAGFINLKKLYCTVGTNGFVEAAEFLGIKSNNNDEFKNFLKNLLIDINSVIDDESEKLGYLINTEAIPGESLSVKNAKWDKKDNLVVPRDVYSSYFYAPEDTEINDIDKFIITGYLSEYCGGGAALHLNQDDFLTEEGYYKLLCLAAKTGTNFYGFNVKNTFCENCGNIEKHTLDHCPRCNSKNISYLTRIIGYLKKTTSFSSERQIEESLRYYHKN